MATNESLVWLDLCSGLGGASQPALDRGWKVIRVDIDPRFRPDIVADVRRLPLKPFHVDVLWASPPCQDFSKHGLRCFYPNPPEPDLSIISSVDRTIKLFGPRWWVIENVLPARRFLTPYLGPVLSTVPGHAFWGSLPCLLPLTRAHKLPDHRRGRRSKKHLNRSWVATGHNGTDAKQAAKIPYEIGEAICRAVERRRDDGLL